MKQTKSPYSEFRYCIDRREILAKRSAIVHSITFKICLQIFLKKHRFYNKWS